jgi:hypothetical protein
MDTVKSSRLSIAEAKTAIEPLIIPMVSFNSTNRAATLLDATVAFFSKRNAYPLLI